jgi:hypothetical protein
MVRTFKEVQADLGSAIETLKDAVLQFGKVVVHRLLLLLPVERFGPMGLGVVGLLGQAHPLRRAMGSRLRFFPADVPSAVA